MTDAHVFERVALVIAQVPGVGRRRLRQLTAAAGEPAGGEAIRTAEALHAFLSQAAPRVGMAVPAASACRTAWETGSRLFDRCRQRGWQVWTPRSAAYPEALQRLSDPPAVLFVHGTGALPAGPRLAIVGTREPTPWGEATAADAARLAAACDVLVISGLAWGIDTAAHMAVVDAGGRTWAMLPSALDVVYPSANRALASRIVEAGGALLSEYPPGTRPQPTFFIERDRLQAALADAVLVVETGRTGGTQHTIRFARQLGVPVWTILPAEVVTDDRLDPSALPVAQQGTWDLWRGGAPLATPEWLARQYRGARGQGRLF
jgi:DNA protecting protein DprA